LKSITQLTPATLWQIFYQLTQIPRPSKHEAAVIAWLQQWCDQQGLSHSLDQAGNLIIRKPATPGMENRKTVVMQGHVDMVPQKNADSSHNFEQDPIVTYIDGDWVTARGTTLGADNGIGVAAALAVLIEPGIQHGPLEVLLTIDEEAGMTGAKGLKPGWLEGEILLNLDTEDEGELYVGCAGGVDVSASVAMQWEPISEQSLAFEVAVTGLRGGHSGLDIDKGRGNANKIINRFLLESASELNLKVFEFNGGTLRNAIPRESFTKVVVDADKEPLFRQRLTAFTQTIRQELQRVEPNLSIAVSPIDNPHRVYTAEATERLLWAVAACTSGVTRMSDEFPGVVETSNNLAVVRSEGDDVRVLCLVRSLLNSARDDLALSLAGLFKLAGASVTVSGDYPGWTPNAESKILTLVIERYKALYGKAPEVKVIHAGLECGLLSEPYPHWDMISFGPTIRHAHSPDEKVHIESVEKFWRLLVDTLQHIPEKSEH
jgi:dipeptidase D